MIEGRVFAGSGSGETILKVDRDKSALSKIVIYNTSISGTTVNVETLDSLGSSAVTLAALTTNGDVVIDANNPFNYLQFRVVTGGNATFDFSYIERNG